MAVNFQTKPQSTQINASAPSKKLDSDSVESSKWLIRKPSEPEDTQVSQLRYVGRHNTSGEADSQLVNLGDLEVLPAEIVDLPDCEILNIEDLLSFPFEEFGQRIRNSVVKVQLPDLDFITLDALFGNQFLTKLTPFDSVGCRNDKLWKQLQQRFGWPNSMRDSSTSPKGAGVTFADQVETVDRVRLEQGSKASNLPVLEVFSSIVTVVAKELGRTPITELHGLNLACFVPSVWANTTVVAEAGQEQLSALQIEYSGVVNGSSPIVFAQNSRSKQNSGIADLVFAVNNTENRTLGEITAAFSAMHKALGIGGRLVIAESVLGRFSPNDLTDILLDASGGSIVLEDARVASARDEKSDVVGLYTFSKLGVPAQL